MARKAKQLETNNRSKLIERLGFVAAANTDKDVDKYSYVIMRDNVIIAANDVFAVGTPTDAEVELCVHGAKLKAALEACGQVFQLTQLDSSSVSVKSDKFKAVIPCIDPALLPSYKPDPIVAVIGPSITDAFSLLHPLISEKSDRTLDHCLHLRPFTAVATNGGMLFEYYHGYDLPPGLLIPKATVVALSKMKGTLHGLGFSQHSVTFWFDNNSYVRSKLIEGQYPNTDRLWYEAIQLPIPGGLYTGLDAVDKFVDNDSVYFHSNHIATSPSLDIGANYSVEGLPAGHCYSMAYWKRTRDLFTSVTWPPDHSKPVQLFGDKVRALIIGKQGWTGGNR